MSFKLGHWPSHLLLGFGLLAIVAYVMQPSVEHLLSIVLHSTSYDYTFFAPFLTLFLIWYRYSQLTEKGRPVPPCMDMMGAWGVGVSLAVYLLFKVSGIDFFGHLAFVMSVWAVALLVMGRRQIQFYGYALLSLAFIIPFGETIIPKLQVISASGAVGLISLFGLPATSDGVFMYLSGGTYEIVRACAGLHFLTTSLMLGYFLSNLLFERFRDRLTIMLLAAVVPVFVNILRVITIVLFAELYSFDFAVSTDHMIYGWVFLTVILMVLIGLAYRMAPSRKYIRLPLRFPATSSFTPIAASLIFVIIAGFVQLRIDHASIKPCQRPLVTMAELGDWRELPEAQSKWQAGFKGFDYKKDQIFRQAGTRVIMKTVFYAYQRNGHELLSLSNKIGDRIFRHLPDQDNHLYLTDGSVVTERQLSSGQQRKLVWVIYYHQAQRKPTAFALWSALLGAKIQGRNNSAAALMLAIDMDNKTNDTALLKARDHLRDFSSRLSYSVIAQSSCVEN